MSGKKANAIPEPHVGMVIREDDPRAFVPKRIVEMDDFYAHCRAGRDGTGNRSRISLRRLREGRYQLVSSAKEPTE